jgi:hypothetical protein
MGSNHSLGQTIGGPTCGQEEDRPLGAAKPHRRVAYCDCGARLAGDSEQALFEAAERHVARQHPELMTAVGRESVGAPEAGVGGS